jgi:hypothetical protein
MDPIRCSECSAHFCKSCIELWINNKNTCPNCRRSIKLEKAEKTLIEDLHDLEIYCKNSEKGCEIKINYQNLLKHENELCEYRLTKCEWCDFHSLSKDIIDHDQICTLKKIFCRGCEKNIQYLEFTNHYIPCIEKTIDLLRKAQLEVKKRKKIRFSNNPYLRHHSIVTQGNNVAIMTNTKPNLSGTILMKPRLKEKQIYEWSIKIINLTEWIGIGISNFGILASKGFKLSDAEIENRDNGCIMISNNCIKWSHFFADENYKKGFEFYKNDVIDVKYNSINFQLTFTLKNNNIIMKLPPLTTSYYPVVILGSSNDSVEIINSN